MNALAEAYERDGFVVLKGLFNPDEMEAWKDRVVQQMRSGGWDQDPSGVKVWMADDLDPFFRDTLTGGRMASSLEGLLGPGMEFLSVKPVFKNHTVTFGTPWHHDWAYWGGSHKVSAWIALDEATPANGCLKMIPGSHRNKVDMQRHTGEGGFANRIDESEVEGLPVVTLAASPGDVILFHDLTLHASFPNDGGQDRWSFIATYRDASEPDASTVWSCSLPVQGPVESGD